MDYNARRRINCQGGSVLYTVVGFDKFYPKAAQINVLSVFYHFPLYLRKHVVLFQFIIYNADGQFRCVNRHVDVTKDIGNGADMILVAVGNKKSLYFLNVVLKISGVRYYQINAEHIVFRKSQTAVHYNNTVFVFKGSNVHSNLL